MKTTAVSCTEYKWLFLLRSSWWDYVNDFHPYLETLDTGNKTCIHTLLSTNFRLNVIMCSATQAAGFTWLAISDCHQIEYILEERDDVNLLFTCNWTKCFQLTFQDTLVCVEFTNLITVGDVSPIDSCWNLDTPGRMVLN